MSDVHNHPGLENFEALSAGYWPAKPPRLERYALQTRVDSIRIPVAQISRSAAGELLHGAERPLDALARAAESDTAEKALTLDDLTVTVSTDVRRHVVPDRSVIAALEGNDPKLKDEWVRYDKMEHVVRLVHQASWDLAQQDARPRLDRPQARARGR